jgi:predicted transposase/invertase (TIGR01784 family)
MPKSRLSPHDRFIRSLMTNPRVIREFFDHHLPDKIKEILDFSSIEPQKESFVEDSLRLQIADLLYAVRFNGNPGFLYVLLEHASTPQEMLPFRMLKYMTKIMDSHLQKTGSKQLPLIYPCIIYTGEKPYKYSMDFFDLFREQKDLAKEMMTSPYHLIDLTQVSDEVLRQYQFFGAMALLAKHIHDPDILPFFKSFLDILRKLESQNEVSYIYTIISYVVEAGEVSDKAEFLQTIKRLESVSEEKIMTIAEQFRQEGKIEGKIETSHAIAFNLMKLGIHLEQISKATSISVTELQDMKKKIH